MRGGKLYEAKWGVRGRGEGFFADQIEALFEVCRPRHFAGAFRSSRCSTSLSQ